MRASEEKKSATTGSQYSMEVQKLNQIASLFTFKQFLETFFSKSERAKIAAALGKPSNADIKLQFSDLQKLKEKNLLPKGMTEELILKKLVEKSKRTIKAEIDSTFDKEKRQANCLALVLVDPKGASDLLMDAILTRHYTAQSALVEAGVPIKPTGNCSLKWLIENMSTNTDPYRNTGARSFLMDILSRDPEIILKSSPEYVKDLLLNFSQEDLKHDADSWGPDFMFRDAVHRNYRLHIEDLGYKFLIRKTIIESAPLAALDIVCQLPDSKDVAILIRDIFNPVKDDMFKDTEPGENYGVDLVPLERNWSWMTKDFFDSPNGKGYQAIVKSMNNGCGESAICLIAECKKRYPEKNFNDLFQVGGSGYNMMKAYFGKPGKEMYAANLVKELQKMNIDTSPLQPLIQACPIIQLQKKLEAKDIDPNRSCSALRPELKADILKQFPRDYNNIFKGKVSELLQRIGTTINGINELTKEPKRQASDLQARPEVKSVPVRAQPATATTSPISEVAPTLPPPAPEHKQINLEPVNFLNQIDKIKQSLGDCKLEEKVVEGGKKVQTANFKDPKSQEIKNFEIHEKKLVTYQIDVSVFEAMLKSYKAVHKEPPYLKVEGFLDEPQRLQVQKAWVEAITKVYPTVEERKGAMIEFGKPRPVVKREEVSAPTISRNSPAG